MTNKYLYILLYILLLSNTNAQDYCSVLSNPGPTPLGISSVCTLDETKNNYTIRINVHYLLRSDGTGNFTETSDPSNSGSGYNGYKFAAEVLKSCNKRLSNNAVMHFQVNPSMPEPALSINLRYVLNGVYFWRNTTDYNNSAPAPNNPNLTYLKNTYAQDVGMAINIFFVKNNPTPTAGQGAAYFNDDVCFVRGQDEVFQRFLNNGNDWEYITPFFDIVNHEILHNINLNHTIRQAGGTCCDITPCDDGCTDTPTYQQILANGYINICQWCKSDFVNKNVSSNNMMDYSCWLGALSPCQINRINSHIINNKVCYLSCSYPEENINICSSPIQSQSYIAKNINVVPTSCSSSSIILPSLSRIVFNAETTAIHKNFEVPLGSEFEIIPVSSCN